MALWGGLGAISAPRGAQSNKKEANPGSLDPPPPGMPKRDHVLNFLNIFESVFGICFLNVFFEGLGTAFLKDFGTMFGLILQSLLKHFRCGPNRAKCNFVTLFITF